jgi:hypothetical protein
MDPLSYLIEMMPQAGFAFTLMNIRGVPRFKGQIKR